jgi:hypothetical protein
VARARPVIAGFGGDLISHAYVEDQLGQIDGEQLAGFERRLVRWWRAVSRSLGPASGARAVLDVAVHPLLQLLDHERAGATPEAYGFSAPLPSAGAVLVSLPWASPPASAWPRAVRLGVSARADWGLICNGRALRIVDCTRTWTHAGIEFDFDRLTSGPKGMAALWLLGNAAAIRGTLRSHVLASDLQASRICRSVSDGVLSSLPQLAGALAEHAPVRMQSATALDQALTLVYRILFLLFAEARSLVPVWNDLYRSAYSIDALTERASRSATVGLWEGLQAISRVAHSGCKAGDLDVTAFNGRLFSPRHAPLVEQRTIHDGVIRDVLLALATESTRQGRRRISYHDLGVEQLGSIYERVLEYEPAGRAGSWSLARTSNQRKATGSFYTPRALTEYLVRRTLAPLVADRSADQILDLRIADPAMGSGAFLVAACRFLADSCEHAMIRDGQWLEADASASHRATLRRLVAERCLYGVDLNPTAVQLARLSLWLTTLAADRPLTFLDHHLASGNSLIGARLADLSRPPRPRSGKTPAPLPLFDDSLAEVTAEVLPIRLRLALEPSDSLDAVRRKERALAALTRPDGPIAKWTAAADAWCAAALWPGPSPSAAVVTEWIAGATGAPTTLPAAQLRASLERARAIAAAHGAFHWELAFPEVFFAADGQASVTAGFDAVIGNPPWDMLRADYGSSTERADARSTTASALRFCRVSRAYQHQGNGHPNCYQLFLERGLQLLKPGGRIGLLLPSGIATDHGSAALRRYLLDRTAIDTWLGFDNRRRIFPIHRSMRFVLLSAATGGSTATLRMRNGLTDVSAIDGNRDGDLAISRSRLEAWSPDHLTIPELTSSAALGIVTTIADRVPPLADAAGWHVRFGRELNATDDRPQFVKMDGRPRAGLLPVVEGKQLSPFQVDLDRSQFAIPARMAAAKLDRSSTFARPRLAYRDVASATNKLTLIAARLPAGVVSTHTVFCLKSALDERAQWCLLGLLNSLVANYLVRLHVTTHVTTALMARLPVPRPAENSPEFQRLVELSRRLAHTGITDDSPDYAELNSIAAHLYGITRDDYAFILESFPLICRAQRDRCLSAYSP